MRIYFAFGDRVLGYDCAACGERCCRGWGFSPSETELAVLLQRYPGLALFCRAGGKANRSTVWNFPPGCFFLDGARCVLHCDHGFEAKPFTCRFFPANQFLLLGDILIVDLHPLCPVEPAAPGKVVLAHAELEGELRRWEEQVIARAATLMLSFPAERAVQHEVWCRDRLQACSDALSAAGAMAAAAMRLSDASLDLGELPVEAGPRDELAAHQAQVVRFLDVEGHLPDAPGGLLLALSPSLRLALLAQLPWLSYLDFVTAYPRMWLVLELYLRVFGDTSHSPITAETIRQVMDKNGRLFWLLANLDRLPKLAGEGIPEQATVRIPRNLAGEVRRLLSFIYSENRTHNLTLAQVLESLGVESPRSRIELLAALPDEILSRLRFE